MRSDAGAKQATESRWRATLPSAAPQPGSARAGRWLGWVALLSSGARAARARVADPAAPGGRAIFGRLELANGDRSQDITGPFALSLHCVAFRATAPGSIALPRSDRLLGLELCGQ